jgi:hypothetical protein
MIAIYYSYVKTAVSALYFREMLEIAVLIFVMMKILNPAFTQKRGDVLKNLGSDLGTASPMQARPPLPRRNKPTKFSTARLQLAAVQN